MPHKLESKGLSAWVQVNGKKLRCYETSKAGRGETRAVSCWIASQENESFSVHLSKPRRSQPCLAYLFLDGHQVAKRVTTASDTSAVWWRKVVDGYRRPYTFSSQAVGDDDALLEGSSDAQANIGEIEIRVVRISGLKTTRVPSKKSMHDEKDILPAIQTIHETRVKAAKPPHQIALGEPISKKNYSAKTCDRYKYQTEETLATFIFRYRALDTLVDNGIAAPRAGRVSEGLRATSATRTSQAPTGMLPPPSPVASSNRLPAPPAPVAQPSVISSRLKAENGEAKSVKGDPDEVELLEDEEQLLLARLESVRSRKRKALADPERETSTKAFKREQSIPRGRFTPGEVIDLT